MSNNESDIIGRLSHLGTGKLDQNQDIPGVKPFIKTYPDLNFKYHFSPKARFVLERILGNKFDSFIDGVALSESEVGTVAVYNLVSENFEGLFVLRVNKNRAITVEYTHFATGVNKRIEQNLMFIDVVLEVIEKIFGKN
jgi:hypothetical protein